MAIDYERMKKVYPKQKAALTRAMKQPIGVRFEKVAAVCLKAVQEWDAIGAWPDGWALWQRSLDDARMTQQLATRTHIAPILLEEL